jgi:hypothetical protein
MVCFITIPIKPLKSTAVSSPTCHTTPLSQPFHLKVLRTFGDAINSISYVLYVSQHLALKHPCLFSSFNVRHLV